MLKINKESRRQYVVTVQVWQLGQQGSYVCILTLCDPLMLVKHSTILDYQMAMTIPPLSKSNQLFMKYPLLSPQQQQWIKNNCYCRRMQNFQHEPPQVWPATTIQLGQQTLIPIDIIVQPPQGTYIQIATCSGLVVKHHTIVKAGVIDNNLTVNVVVL
jgi:hypothetical protein